VSNAPPLSTPPKVGGRIVTGILEVKFSDDRSNAVSFGQSQRHMDILAAAYQYIPDEESLGAPLYAIVTLLPGEVTDADGFGRTGRTEDMIQYANDKGLNLSHMKVVDDGTGTFVLKGQIVNNPKEVEQIAREVSLGISCQPEIE